MTAQRVVLNGRTYVLEMQGYRRSTLPANRQSQDQSREPGDQTFTTEGPWRRVQRVWGGGTGLQRPDDVEVDKRDRFAVGVGVDCSLGWAVRPGPILSETVVTVRTQTTTPGSSFYGQAVQRNYSGDATVKVGDYLYVFDGTSTYTVWAAPVAAHSSLASFTIDPAGHEYRAFSTGGLTKDGAAFGATTPNVVGFAIGRLFGGLSGGRLAEYDSAGALGSAGKLDYTHAAGSRATWVAITALPNGILAACRLNDGSSELWVSTPSTAGVMGTPTLVARFDDAAIRGLCYAGGLLMVVFADGCRLCSLSEGGQVVIGPLKTMYAPSGAVTFDGRWFYVGGQYLGTPNAESTSVDTTALTAFNNTPDAAGLAMVWRFDAATFTDGYLDPAAEPFLIPPAPTSGAVAGQPTCVGLVADPDRHGSGTRNDYVSRIHALYDRTVTGTNRPTAGWCDVASPANVLPSYPANAHGWSRLVVGPFAFGTTGLKRGVRIRLVGRFLNTLTGTVRAAVSSPGGGGDGQTITSWTDGGGEGVYTGALEADLDPTLSWGQTLEVDVQFTKGQMLYLEQVQLVAGVVADRVDEWIVPLLLSDTVQAPDGSVLGYDVDAEYDAMKALEAAGTVVTYSEGSRSAQVVVDRVQFEGRAWQADGSWLQGVMTVRLISAVPT